MPETIPNPIESEEESSNSQVRELVEKASSAFEVHDYQTLDKALLELGQELGVELKTPHDEMLKKNQTYLNWLFGIDKYNLKQEYIKGNIKLPTKEQEKAAQKEGYTLRLIVPSNIPRNEVIDTVKNKYATEFNSQGVYIWTTEDINKTKPETRPQGLYVLNLKPQANIADAHKETLGQTPAQLQETLTRSQKKDLNLKGLTLPEYLLFDAYQFQTNQHHLDEQGWEYLLEETVPGTARALDAYWYPVDREVSVYSHSDAHSVMGARFAAVSYISPSS